MDRRGFLGLLGVGSVAPVLPVGEALQVGDGGDTDYIESASDGGVIFRRPRRGGGPYVYRDADGGQLMTISEDGWVSLE